MSKHIHRFKRINIGQNGKKFWVMKCIKANCTHYTPMASKLSAPLLRDTIAECNKCKNKFQLNRRALRMEKPICEDCVERRPSKEVTMAEKLLADLERDMFG